MYRVHWKPLPDKTVLCKPAGRPGQQPGNPESGKVRPKSAENCSSFRPHRKRCRGIDARGAVFSGLAGSAYENCRAAQARAQNPEQRQTGQDISASAARSSRPRRAAGGTTYPET